MKQILESMLDELEWLSKNASSWEYYLGKYDLCKELLSQCDEMMCSFQEDAYNDYDEDWSVDEWTMHNDDLAWYKQQEIDQMHYDRYNYLYPIGYRDILDVDGLWFTSDEIEAFREIWQRRISAL